MIASKCRAWAAGPEGKVTFRWRDMWEAKLSSMEMVVVFGVPEIMHKLEARLARDLKPGTRVCSNQFPLPSWTPAKQENGVYCYCVPEHQRKSD